MAHVVAGRYWVAQDELEKLEKWMAVKGRRAARRICRDSMIVLPCVGVA